jgi:hypothetical protein
VGDEERSSVLQTMVTETERAASLARAAISWLE